MTKLTLNLDFDGVINSYKSGWLGETELPDPPVPGALAFIIKARKDFEITICSSRAKSEVGRKAIQEYLQKYFVHQLGLSAEIAGQILDEITITNEKPAAYVSIDDRALTFNGEWPSIEELKTFQPWYRKPAEPRAQESMPLLPTDIPYGIKKNDPGYEAATLMIAWAKCILAAVQNDEPLGKINGQINRLAEIARQATQYSDPNLKEKE